MARKDKKKNAGTPAPADKEKKSLPLRIRTLYQPGTAEIVIKKSRFIAHAAPAQSEEEAAAFISSIRRQYWDARHNCHAFSVGNGAPGSQLTRCSDDGEPAQTAGKPMLDVLLGEGLWDTVIVVTRYFGGTLLGTGGLVRAYSQSARAGLEAGTMIEKVLCSRVGLDAEYPDLVPLQRLAADREALIEDTQYGEKIRMQLLIPFPEKERFQKELTEMSAGRLAFRELETVYGAQAGGRTLVFPAG